MDFSTGGRAAVPQRRSDLASKNGTHPGGLDDAAAAVGSGRGNVWFGGAARAGLKVGLAAAVLTTEAAGQRFFDAA